MKPENRNVLIGFLSFVIIIGIWGFVVLNVDFGKAKKRLAETEQQVVAARQELVQERQEKEALQGQLTEVRKNLDATVSELREVKEKLATAEKDNTQLQQVKQELQQRIASLESEKQALEARLHSLKELKKAIRQVKIEIHNKKVEQRALIRQQQKELDARRLQTGNRGFLIRDGSSTYKPKVIIEVSPTH